MFLTYLVHSKIAIDEAFLLLMILKGIQNSSQGLIQMKSSSPTSQLSPLWKKNFLTGLKLRIGK